MAWETLLVPTQLHLLLLLLAFHLRRVVTLSRSHLFISLCSILSLSTRVVNVYFLQLHFTVWGTWRQFEHSKRRVAEKKNEKMEKKLFSVSFVCYFLSFIKRVRSGWDDKSDPMQSELVPIFRNQREKILANFQTSSSSPVATKLKNRLVILEFSLEHPNKASCQNCGVW